jgi:perosamine synthetase
MMAAPAPDTGNSSTEKAIRIAAPMVGDEERQAVLEVLDSGMLVQGAKVAELEKAFAGLVGVAHAVAVSSGTAALHLALLAHGIGAGDEVITTPFSFVATVNSILQVGATPVLADVDPATFNLDPERVDAVVTLRTRAIMPVHLYGQCCDMDPIMEIARRHDLWVIEDAAQAVQATYRGIRAGSFGTGCFSLYATKNVMSAEGGIVTTRDPELADRVRVLRNQGMRERYRYELLGYNYRMTDVHAALGVAQVGRVDEVTRRRRENAAVLSAGITSVSTPSVAPGCEHVWHQFTVRLPNGSDRDAAIERLRRAGIGTSVFYPEPLHRLPHVRSVVGDVRLPVAEDLAGRVLSLPVHPALTEEDLRRIVVEVNRL